MMFATEDWAQGWELNSPSTRPGSSDMLAVTAVATLSTGAPRDFWALLQEMGPDFAMGPGLLGGFPRALSAVGFADLGKRWRRAAFRAYSACETAQKFAGDFGDRIGPASSVGTNTLASASTV